MKITREGDQLHISYETPMFKFEHTEKFELESLTYDFLKQSDIVKRLQLTASEIKVLAKRLQSACKTLSIRQLKV